MLDRDFTAIPTEELYWTKVKLEDEEFKMERKMRKVKSAKKKDDLREQTLFIIGEISKLEDRMFLLNI